MLYSSLSGELHKIYHVLGEPRTNSLYIWLKFGRAAVLLALFVIMITAVNTVMYEVIYRGHEFPILYILLGRFQHTRGMFCLHFRIECSPIKEHDKSYCKLLSYVIKIKLRYSYNKFELYN